MKHLRGGLLHVLGSLEPEMLLVGDNQASLAFDRATKEARAAADGHATPGMYETSMLNGRIVISRIDGGPGHDLPGPTVDPRDHDPAVEHARLVHARRCMSICCRACLFRCPVKREARLIVADQQHLGLK